MKFFTYDYGSFKNYQWPYLILKIGRYLKLKNKKPYKFILIDPGVYDLQQNPCYSWEESINIPQFLDSLPENHYFSWDYPGDMNPQYSELFLQKSWDNAYRFSDHPNYITTVQFRFNNYLSFIEWFNKYNELPMTSGIMGIGNMCQQKGLNQFVRHAIPYIIKNSKANWIHIYGLNILGIKYLSKFKTKKIISVDNRKWEYYVKSSERPQAFKKYINKLENYIES